ncbi:hypothetical protein PHISCL_03848 [Aspergillus sclerotialis]|uniref:Zn(2)-C6 fungal-type domain-containing protein n=1 Tax=Aspergillus sclerotialis TaxID=2070753 RepID=A0A3A2ZQT4_9EURO|nr:hypothetical protein PHISCL_03848 [Aspergillus sclerotialis]
MPRNTEDSESSSSSSQAKRTACNRCHLQKLRCVSDPAGSRSCVRCQRKGVNCVYGPPRRMGRPKAQSSIGTSSPGDNIVQGQAGTVTGDDTSNPSRTSAMSGDLQEWDYPAHDELPRHLTSNTEGAGHNLTLPMFNDFSFLDTPSPSSMAQAKRSDRVLSVACPSSTTAEDFDLDNSVLTHMELGPFNGINHAFGPRASSGNSEQASETISTVGLPNENQQTSSPVVQPPNEDEQIQTLSSLSLVLFQCDRSIACCASKNPHHALHSFSLCALMPATSSSEHNCPSTTHNTAQIDQLLDHTRTLKCTLETLWHLPQNHRQQPPIAHQPGIHTNNSANFSSNDQATTLLGLSCYIRLLQIYNTILDNLGCSLKVLCAHPAAQNSEIRVGCFALSSAQSLQVVLYLISQLLGELHDVVISRLCVSGPNNDGVNLHSQRLRFPMDVQVHAWGFAPRKQNGENNALEEAANHIRDLERCVQEKIGTITNELLRPPTDSV